MLTGTPDFQKAHEESDDMVRLAGLGGHASIGELGCCVMVRVLRNQQAILRSLQLLLESTKARSEQEKEK